MIPAGSGAKRLLEPLLEAPVDVFDVDLGAGRVDQPLQAETEERATELDRLCGGVRIAANPDARRAG